MIAFQDQVFALETKRTSYIFRVTHFGHLEHIHYGERVPRDETEPLVTKRNIMHGSSVLYSPQDSAYCLDNLPLEWSGIGCGDYRQTPLEVKLANGTYRTDFLYESHQIVQGCVPMETLPSAYDETNAAQTLIVTLADRAGGLELLLYYSVFPAVDVITRRVVLINTGEGAVSIRRIMSLSLDMENEGFSLVTFDGAWIKETHRHDRKLQYGQFVNSSVTGASSNRHNPGFLLFADGATQSHGRVYGFNLIYSGNHIGLAELSPFDLIRVQLGINQNCFEWELAPGAQFETPEAVMTFSPDGFNGMSAHFHDFVNAHIVRGDWKGKERPVLINNWEACFFRFTRSKLLRLARQARRLGVELFVLDDGWFGKRNDDHAGLGDYDVNRKKLPRGMKSFADEIRALGLRFGLWFEPEMVNSDSDLFRAHPEYAVTTPGRTPLLGRNQLVLDLCNPDVRDYIVTNVSQILDDAKIDYVKWDMNRHISDACSPVLANQGEFYHRYIMGLYDVLTRIFAPREQILFESCSSGGNRFDLGMLCFSPQVWSSDDTDAIERLKIQEGLSYLYPLSSMGAHVSASPNQQTLRQTSISTRFNVASFGCLGYELDLKHLTMLERKEVREQIAYYKQHRRTLQYGRFIRHDTPMTNKVYWQTVSQDQHSSLAGAFQSLAQAAEGNDVLPLAGLSETARYRMQTKPQRVFIRRFGGLINHLLPVAINPNGALFRWVDRLYAMGDCVETYTASGKTLMQGVHLNNQFVGTGHNQNIRMLGDFGSSLYQIEALTEKND
ncbi:MAG: alpha-galactosidase [Eubacteriales bacterium]|jgi:alpha-galactosidase|nr:alpha-galactosidase [Eubacteriales bacterium]